MALNNGYSSAQIMAMQKDAIRRVNEMQKIADEKLRQSNLNNSAPPSQFPHSHNTSTNHNNNHDRIIVEGKPVEKEHHADHDKNHTEHIEHIENIEHHDEFDILPVNEKHEGLQGFLDKLNLDDEKIIIILMLILLVNEGADTKLILALVYILL